VTLFLKNLCRKKFYTLASLGQIAKTWKKVHFGWTMHCLPQRLKSTFFKKKNSEGSSKGRGTWSEEFFLKH